MVEAQPHLMDISIFGGNPIFIGHTRSLNSKHLTVIILEFQINLECGPMSRISNKVKTVNSLFFRMAYAPQVPDLLQGQIDKACSCMREIIHSAHALEPLTPAIQCLHFPILFRFADGLALAA